MLGLLVNMSLVLLRSRSLHLERHLKDDPKEKDNLAHEKPEIVTRLKADYEAWYQDVSSTRPNNYAAPLMIVGTEHENPTDLTRQDWRGTSWAFGSVGHWMVRVAKEGEAEVEVIFHPDEVGKEVGEVTLQVGDKKYVEATTGNRVTFPEVKLKKGAVRLEGTWAAEGKKVSAWQVKLMF